MKNATEHAHADVPAVMSALNVTQPAAHVLDTQLMNVSTAGVEPKSMVTDVACATATLDSKPLETSVNKLLALARDVTHVTRVNVFIANMGMTFMTEHVQHAVSKTAQI